MMRLLLVLVLALFIFGCPDAGSAVSSKMGWATLDTRGADCYDFSTPALFNCNEYPESADLELVGKCTGRPLMKGEWMHVGAGELEDVRSVPENADFSGSEDYSRAGHVYIIRTREKEYVKMKITDLISLKKLTGECEWQMKIEFVYQPGGLMRFAG